MAQLIPLPLTVSCFSKIQIGFTFLYRLTWVVPEKRAVKRVCVCVCPRDQENSQWVLVYLQRKATTYVDGMP